MHLTHSVGSWLLDKRDLTTFCVGHYQCLNCADLKQKRGVPVALARTMGQFMQAFEIKYPTLSGPDLRSQIKNQVTGIRLAIGCSQSFIK